MFGVLVKLALILDFRDWDARAHRGSFMCRGGKLVFGQLERKIIPNRIALAEQFQDKTNKRRRYRLMARMGSVPKRLK